MWIQENQASVILTQAHEWGRAIVQAYMSWYVFFVAGNIAMLAWIHTRRVFKATKKTMSAFRGIAAILALLNAGGILSSGFILWYLKQLVSQDFPLLVVIFVAGIANTIALVALLLIWSWVIWRKTYETPFSPPKN